MNDTIDLLKNHVSVRSFTSEKISQEEITELLLAAQSASSSSFLQSYTIIGIEDQAKKEKIAQLAGNQPFIAEASHFFIFCGDLHRLHVMSEELGVDLKPNIEGLDATLIGAVDAALVAQNMTIAAESLGLGVCYIGGVRDAVAEIATMLELPDYVFPVFGLVIGHPRVKNQLKPRIPLAGIYHVDHYNHDLKDVMADYQETTKVYYANRSGGQKQGTWGESAVNSLHRQKRLGMKAFLNEQGLAKL